MQWIDEAVIVALKKIGEKSVIMTTLTKENGLVSGMVHGLASKKDKGAYQPGNIISVKWRSRLADQLGSFTLIDVKHSIASAIIYNAKKLYALNALLCLIKENLPDNDPHHHVYADTVALLNQLLTNEHWIENYILFECNLLANLGFGLELDKCAVSGKKQDLYYVSPNTGRAVTKNVGHQYHDKLLRLPPFMTRRKEKTGNPHQFIDNASLIDGLMLTEFFLSKYIYRPQNKTLPIPRQQLVLSIKQITKQNKLVG